MTPTIAYDLTGSEPAGSHGVRRGYWSVLVDGRRARIYLSISHSLPLKEQQARVLETARHAVTMGTIEYLEA